MNLHRRFGRLLISAISVVLTVLTVLTVLGVQSLTLPSASASSSDTPSHHIKRVAIPHRHKPFKLLGSHAMYAQGKQPKPTATPASGNTPVPASVASGPEGCNGCTPPLHWHGTPVQHFPRIYLIFWGPEWQTNDPTSGNPATIDALVTLFGGLAGSDYNNILSQYGEDACCPDNYPHNTTELADYVIDTTAPPTTVTRDGIGMEAADTLVYLQDAGLWSEAGDAQFLVFPQQGTSYESWFDDVCGFHGMGAASDVGGVGEDHPYLTFGMGKYKGANCQEMTVVASHEYAETVTDPYADGSGWATNECFSQFCPLWNWAEIGDLCHDGTAVVGIVTVQKLWDNFANGCVTQSTHVKLAVGSNQGDPFTLASHTGTAVLTYGQHGCTAVDSNGFCTSGVWLTIPGAHWIWPTRLWDPNTQSMDAVTFTKQFSIPDNATNITGDIVIDADNFYALQVNGQDVGRGEDWTHPDTYDLSPFLHTGTNTITAMAGNDPYDPDPIGNPAGLIYRADIGYVSE